VSEYKTQEPEISSDPYPVANDDGDQLPSNKVGNRKVAQVLIGARLVWTKFSLPYHDLKRDAAISLSQLAASIGAR
jgi:hypothetical protein